MFSNEATSKALAPQKRNAYAKRLSESIPAPIEYDPDSDFAPGPIKEPEKPKNKRKTKTQAGRETSKREVSKSSSFSKKSSKSKRKSPAISPNLPNPLIELFADGNFDLKEEEDEEEEEEDEEEEDEEEEEEEEEEYDSADRSTRVYSSKSTRPPPPPPKPEPIVVDDDSATESDSEPLPPPEPKGIVKPDTPIVDDDSATESDTDPDWVQKRTLKRKSQSPSEQPNKKAKVAVSEDDSATESDSAPGSVVQPSPRTDSATESDPETNMLTKEMLYQGKPGFPLRPGQKRLGPLVLDEEQDTKVPYGINTHLRPYQRDGIEFFWRQYKQGRGGLLGDDMGLGKTIQVISFLSAIMKKEGLSTDIDRRRKHVSRLQDGEMWRKHRKLPPANSKWPTCLIVAPSSVVPNWEREFSTWGYFEVGMYIGTPDQRRDVLRDFQLGRLDVVITSFTLARNDIELLDDLAWSCIFVDEVHTVKKESSQTTTAFLQFTCETRFGLTGTAIQNSYKEFWTILNWTSPGRIGTAKQWNQLVAKPLVHGQSASASSDVQYKSRKVAETLRDKLLPQFFLRRTKDIIKDQLPTKTDLVVFCPLSESQKTVYKNILNTAAVQDLIRRDEPCDCGSRKQRKACCHPFVPGEVFKYMSILIKLSNHLGLILPGSPKDTVEQTARNRELMTIAFPTGQAPSYGLALLDPQYCGKWKALEHLLQDFRQDRTNKVLIFTKSAKLLEMLEFHLSRKSYGFLKLDGNTKQSDRMPMIDQFNTDPEIFVFLISTLAGGTGLNLTGANKVVIFDPNWNPAYDLQAMDRAFRFGQRRDVSVFRLLGAGSIEELIYARQIYKQQQMAIGYEASVQTRYFTGVQGDRARPGELFGLANIFKLHEGKLATEEAIEKANIAEMTWALSKMSGTKSKKPSTKGASDVLTKEENMQALASLLLDDGPIINKRNQKDEIQKTLNAIGVRYSHVNDDIIAPSKIEEQRTKEIIKERRQRKAKPPPADKSSKNPGRLAFDWPPRRRHHKPKPPPSAEETLHARRDALIALEIINGPEDISGYAQKFVKMTVEEQQELIGELDKFAEENAD